MAVADVYDTLISRRAYKAALTHDEAVAIIAQGHCSLEEIEAAGHARGSSFDPDVIDAFVAVQEEFREVAERYRDAA
jgi:putative two-component system response regulator